MQTREWIKSIMPDPSEKYGPLNIIGLYTTETISMSSTITLEAALATGRFHIQEPKKPILDGLVTVFNDLESDVFIPEGTILETDNYARSYAITYPIVAVAGKPDTQVPVDIITGKNVHVPEGTPYTQTPSILVATTRGSHGRSTIQDDMSYTAAERLGFQNINKKYSIIEEEMINKQEREKMRETIAIREYMKRKENQCGYLAAIAQHSIIGWVLDIIGNPTLFHALKEKLLRSVMMAGQIEHQETKTTRKDIDNFFAYVKETELHEPHNTDIKPKTKGKLYVINHQPKEDTQKYFGQLLGVACREKNNLVQLSVRTNSR